MTSLSARLIGTPRRLALLLRKVWHRLARNEGHPHSLFAPSYDLVTHKTARWAQDWHLEGVTKFIGKKADHKAAGQVARRSANGRRLLFFVGHGNYGGLLTDKELGKTSAIVTRPDEGCLMDCDDLAGDIENLHCVAWACKAGRDFGPAYRKVRFGAFLGFREDVDMMINSEESDLLWGELMEKTFSRALSRGAVSVDDATWLRDQLRAARRNIKSGLISTGRHDRANLMFLKAAANRVCSHIAEG